MASNSSTRFMAVANRQEQAHDGSTIKEEWTEYWIMYQYGRENILPYVTYRELCIGGIMLGTWGHPETSWSETVVGACPTKVAKHR